MTTFGPSFEFFWFLWGCFLVFWDYFEVGFKFKNIFGTYYCWLSILFWNCNSLFLFIIRPNLKPIFLFLMLPQLGPLLPFLSPSGSFFTVWGYFRVSIRLNYILEPINVEYHFLFWKCSPIFFNFIELGGGGPFCIFWSFRGLFWVWGQVQKLFGTCLHSLISCILYV